MSKDSFIAALEKENVSKLMIFAKKELTSHFYTFKSSTGNNIFHVLAKKGTSKQFEELIKLNSSAKTELFSSNHKKQTPLHCAAQAGKIKIAQFLMNYGAYISCADSEGNLPLHLAAQSGHHGMVRQICFEGSLRNSENARSYFPSMLLESKFDVHAQNKLNQSAYRLARIHQKNKVMKVLSLYEGHDNFENVRQSIANGLVRKTKRLLNEDKRLALEMDENNNTLAHHVLLSMGRNRLTILKELIAAGSKVNAFNKAGQTLLHLVAEIGLWQNESEDLFSFLIKKGANVNVADAKGLTILHHAAAQNNVKAIRKLIEHKAYVDRVNIDGMTPLHVAALCNHLEAFKELLAYKADINSQAYPRLQTALFRDSSSQVSDLSPTWLALELGHVLIVKAALDHKFKNNDTTNLYGLATSNSSTLLHFFAATGESDYFNRLARARHYPFLSNAAGYTPLHVAAEFGNFDIVKLIIEKFAPKQAWIDKAIFGTFDLEARNVEGKTAWLLAKEGKHNNIIRYLQSKGAKRLKGPVVEQGVIKRTQDFLHRQSEFKSELERRSIYQHLSWARIVTPVLLYSTLGPVPMAIHLAYQMGSYATPQMFSYFSDAYYKMKPFVHNNMHRYVEQSLDDIASVTSYGSSIAFKGMNVIDWVTNPGRRATGLATSVLLANLAAHYTDNKDVQAAMLFVGREMGHIAIDAYNSYKEKTEPSEGGFDAELNHGFTIWGSIFGKEDGERFVRYVHGMTQLRDDIYQGIGWLEHTVVNMASEGLQQVGNLLTSFESYKYLNAALQNGSDILTPYQGYFTSLPVTLFAKVKKAQEDIGYWRDELLQDIERWIYENALPDSEYCRYAASHLEQIRRSLLSNKALDAEIDKAAAQQAVEDAEQVLKACQAEEGEVFLEAQRKLELAKQNLESKLEASESINLQLEAQQKKALEAWEKTPKGIKHKELRDAQDKELDARIEYENAQIELTFVEQHDATAEERVQAKNKVISKEEELKHCSDVSLLAKEDLIKVLTSIEKEDFEKNEVERQNHLNKMLMESSEQKQAILEKHRELTQAEKNEYSAFVTLESLKRELDDAQQKYHENQKRIYSFEHPGPIVINDLVKQAFALYGYEDKAAVAEFIIKGIVATGVIGFDEAEQRMWDTFLTAQETKNGNKLQNLTKRANEQWKALFTDYKQHFVNNGAMLLKAQQDAKQRYDKSVKDLEHERAKVESQKNDFVKLLPADEQEKFEIQHKQSLTAKAMLHWEISHPLDEIKELLSLLGQTDLAMQVALYHNQSFTPVEMNAFISDTIARWLIEYKNIFFNESNLDIVAEQVTALSSALQLSAITPFKITQEKLKLDEAIAKMLFDNALNHAALAVGSKDDPGFIKAVENEVVTMLQKGLVLDVATEIKVNETPLVNLLSQAVLNNNPAVAQSAITQTLQENTQLFSIKNVGKWEEPVLSIAAPEIATSSHKKKKHHGLSKLARKTWTVIKDVGETVLGGFLQQGIEVGVNATSISAGITGQQMFTIYRFSPEQQALFNLPQKQLSNDPVYHPHGAISSTPLSSEPLPSVLPKGSWEALAPTPSLIQADNFRVVQQNSLSSAPVLPTLTQMPTNKVLLFKGPSTPVPLLKAASKASHMPTLKQSQFELALSPFVKIYPIGEKVLPISDLFDVKNNTNFNFISKHLEEKQLPLEKKVLQQAVKWSELFFKALNGEQSKEVFAWQKENTKMWPLEQPAPTVQQTVISGNVLIAQGMLDAATELFHFAKSEMIKLTHGDETTIGQSIAKAKAFLAEEAYGLATHQTTTPLGRAAIQGWEFVQSDIALWQQGEETQTGQAANAFLYQIGQTTPEALYYQGGKELFYLILGEGVLRGLGYAAGATSSWAVESYFTVEKMTAEFFSGYGIRPPITFAFEHGKLYANVPGDLVKVQKPLYKKDPEVQSHGHKQPPKFLPGFPDAKVVRGKTPYPGGKRKRWEMPDGKFLEWDYMHGEVEMYNKNGNHLGAFDPNKGEKVKNAKKDRNIKRYL